MAITYAYPTAIPELQDLLVGTEMAVQGGEDAPRTRTFTIGSIVDLVEATLPPYTPQVNSDWNATSGFAEILNKPVIPTPPGLQEVLDVSGIANLTTSIDIEGNADGDFSFVVGANNYPMNYVSLVGGAANYTNSSDINLFSNRGEFRHFNNGNYSGGLTIDSLGSKLAGGFNFGNGDTALMIGANTAASTYFKDSRTGAFQSGIEYFADYSTNYTDRSLVDKGYVDSTRPYKVYTALLTQSGINPPTPTVLENTLGGIVVWTYDIEGIYNATLTGAFLPNKTVVFCTKQMTGSGGLIMSGSRTSYNTVSVRVSNSIGNSDGELDNASIEIRVYN